MRRLVLLVVLTLGVAACRSAVEVGDGPTPSSTDSWALSATDDVAGQSLVLADRGIISAPRVLLHPEGEVLVVYGVDVGGGGGPIFVAACSDPACGTVATVEVSPAERELKFVDAEIGPDGELCVLAATVTDQPGAVVLTCTDPGCREVKESSLQLEWPHGMVMAEAGAVVAGVSMEEGQEPFFVLWLCRDAVCREGALVEIARPMDKPGALGFQHDPHALSLSRDGMPQYFYTVEGAASYLATCGDPSCSAIHESEVQRPGVTVSGVVSSVSGPDGSQDVRFVRCADEACSTADDVLVAGELEAIVVDHEGMITSSGLPLVVGRAFWLRLGENRLTIWRCDDPECTNVTSFVADEANHVAAAMLPDGQVAVAFQSGVVFADEAEGADLTGRGLSSLRYIRFDPESLESPA